MRIFFLGTPASAVPVLATLMDAGHQLVGVGTQPEREAGRGRKAQASAVKEFALRKGVSVLEPVTWRSAAAIASVKRLEPDILVVASYGKILPARLLNLPPLGGLNIHPSLLPLYRGPSPVASAILAGERVTGVTVMVMDEGMDTGPILDQVTEGIGENESSTSLTQRLFEIGARRLVSRLDLWADNKISARPQDETQATYTQSLKKDAGEADVHLSAEMLQRKERALNPWPGVYTTWEGRRLKILEASLLTGGQVEVPAGVVRVRSRESKGCLVLGTGDGALALERVQLSGKKPVSARDFIAGHQAIDGAKLPS